MESRLPRTTVGWLTEMENIFTFFHSIYFIHSICYPLVMRIDFRFTVIERSINYYYKQSHTCLHCTQNATNVQNISLITMAVHIIIRPI